MAKKSAASTKNEDTEKHSLLPLADAIVRHHGPTLFTPMREWATAGRVPPVLLITGTPGSAKRDLAHWLAQWILCENSGFSAHGAGGSENSEPDIFGGGFFEAAPAPTPPASPNGEPGPCGNCSSCQRALSGNWVDFTEVLPEDSDSDSSSSGTLKVDQFRKIKQSLGFGAHQGAFRIVLIPNADRMTTQAANSVLKLLEEPPAGWVFFLTASDPTLVLPTILSRCQSLRLRPFTPETLRSLLTEAGVETERASICASLSEGSWSKALALANPEIWEHRNTLFSFLHEPASQLTSLVDWASGSNPHFNLLVDQLEQLSSELVRWSLSPHIDQPENYPWVSKDGKRDLVFHAKAATRRLGGAHAARDFWINRVERLAQIRQEALAPLNRKILVQDLLLPWLNAV